MTSAANILRKGFSSGTVYADTEPIHSIDLWSSTYKRASKSKKLKMLFYKYITRPILYYWDSEEQLYYSRISKLTKAINDIRRTNK